MQHTAHTSYNRRWTPHHTHRFELPATLVVATVVHELARITIGAKASLLIVLTDVRLVVKAVRKGGG